MVVRLRQALAEAHAAKRFVINSQAEFPPPHAREGPGLGDNFPPPLAGEGPGPPAHASRAERAMRAFEASGGGAVVVYVVPVGDTCKEVADGLVVRTVPRDSLAIARGPWVFERDALSSALAMVVGRESEIDSLLALCELTRLQVRVLPSS
jgi:hypothetical protein